MMNPWNLVIAPLNEIHDRKGFHCNVEMLDHYIHKQAGQDIRRRISRVFIASLPDSPKTVVGYYSLSTLSIELSQLPEKLALKLPKHPIPAALVGRLAVSKDVRKCGIGKMLLADAVKELCRSVNRSESTPWLWMPWMRMPKAFMSNLGLPA